MKAHAILGGLMAAFMLPAALAQPADDTGEELEPLVVEGERGPLDGGGYASQVPCIGVCEDEERESPLDRILRDLSTLFIANNLPEQPVPVDSLGTVNPIKKRLDDKQP